jgi:hypothetical protein
VTAARRNPLWIALLVTAVAPLVVHILLLRGHVPLGCPGRFTYLYSPVVSWRLAAVPVAIVLAVIPALGVRLSAATAARQRRAGLGLVLLGAAALAAWSYYAPPDYRNQHVFNAFSPAQDGAFLVEGLRVSDIAAYLRDFPARAATPPAEMRGTRVISNPPAATLLVIGLDRFLSAFPRLATLVPLASAAEAAAARPARRLEHAAQIGLLFFWALTGLWLCAGLAFYAAGRLFCEPPAAAAYAFCCVFSPLTLLFTPGKDPAQLLTVAIPLFLWLAAWRHGRVLWAVLCGVAFAGACLASLVHFWVAGAVLVATLLAVFRDRSELRRVLLRVVLPAGVAALVTFGLFGLVGIDAPATLLAVARAQREVTRGPDAMPLVWQLLGVPLFLLLAGPAWWIATVTLPCSKSGPEPPARFGGALLLVTTVILLATVGFTNLETPRLWLPFVPLMLLGAVLRSPLAGRTRATDEGTSRRTALLLATLVIVQIAVSALHWSLMDPRETETRLVEQRFFG